MAVSELISAGASAGSADALFSFPSPTIRRGILYLVRTVMRIAFRVELRGQDRIPHPPYVMVFNHSSLLDLPALFSALPPKVAARLLTPAAEDYFFQSRVLGSLARWLIHGFPFNRRERSEESLRRCFGELAAGRSLVIAPEGTRSIDGRLQPFRTGFAVLALARKVPVVPVWISGAYRALPKGRWLPRPAKIRIQIGVPVAPGVTPLLRGGRQHFHAVRNLVNRARVGMEELRGNHSKQHLDHHPVRMFTVGKGLDFSAITAAGAVARALTVLVCASCSESPLRVAPVAWGGPGLVCPRCSTRYAFRDGILDLRSGNASMGAAQRFFAFPLIARIYNRVWGPAFWRMVCGRPSEGQLLKGLLARLDGGSREGIVADFACGTGKYTRRIAEWSGSETTVLAMDLSMPMLRRARIAVGDQAHALLICADIEHPPLRAGSLNLAFCWAAIHLLPHHLKFLEGASKVLIGGARLEMMTLGPDGTLYGDLLLKVLKVTKSSNFFLPQDLKADLERAGLEVISVRGPSRALLASAVRPLAQSDRLVHQQS